jgi:hypothetical protein
MRTTFARPESKKRPVRAPKIPLSDAPRVRARKPVSRWVDETLAEGAEGLPEWKDLATGNERAIVRNERTRTPSFLAEVSTIRFALVIVALGVSLGLYVRHVYATQEMLSRLEAARKEQMRLSLRINRLNGVLDQMTSPAAIYERARGLGLEEDILYGPAIRWQTAD